MSRRPDRDDFHDLPILGELRDQLQARFASAAPPARLSTGRRRWSRKGTRLGIVIAALVIAGGSALAAGLLSPQRSRPLTAVFPAGSPGSQTGYGPPGSSYSISISPSMQAGVIGWCTSLVTYRGTRRFDLGTGGCNGAPPAVGAPIFGARDGVGQPELSYVFTAPQVSAVRISSGPTIITRPDPRLPFGYRAAVFSLPKRPLAHQAGITLSALDSSGRVIPGDAYAGPVTEATRSWRAPSPAPAGACSISARPGQALSVQSGSVLTQAVGDPGVLGHAFLPCLDVTFTLHGRHFSAAVLLDAKAPGQLPAELPDMQSVTGHPGILMRRGTMTNFSGNLASNLDIAARRVGDTWLVVGGGAGSRQRIAALNALRVGAADLSRQSPPAQPPRHALCWIAYHPTSGLRGLSQTAPTSPPPILALLKRRSGWHIHGALKYIRVGNNSYILPAKEEAFLAQPPCATATFLLGDWTLEATVQLTAGKGLPNQLKETTLLDSEGAVLRRQEGSEEAALWQRLRGAWLQITGATAVQQEALRKSLIVTPAP